MSEWLSETEAAELLGTSVKTIIRYASQGKIETRKRPRPGKKPENVCNPRDVERLMPTAHIMPPETTAVSVSNPQTLQAQTTNDGWEIASRLLLDRLIQERRGPVQRLWLTIEEAGEYSGRSRNWLLRMCREGRLVAEKDHGWRIRRASLEAYEG